MPAAALLTSFTLVGIPAARLVSEGGPVGSTDGLATTVAGRRYGRLIQKGAV